MDPGTRRFESHVSAGPWIVVAALAVALAFGLYRAATDGRFRGTHALSVVEPRGAEGAERAEPTQPTSETRPLAGTPWEASLGERATLVQFSSAFCAPCRTTRHVLADVAARTEGVVHVEIDAESHLDLVRRLDIRRTPTTLVLGGGGHELTRATGVPRREQVAAALDAG